MKKELNQLMMQRYKYFLLGISLLIVGITFLETKSNLSLWQEERTELNTKKAENSFYKELKSKDSYPNGKMVVFYDDREGKSEVETDNFSELEETEFKSLPIMKIDGKFLTFVEANTWINTQK